MKELAKLASFKSKDYKASLEECFFKMDEMMRAPAGKKELTQSGESGESFAGCTATTLLVTPTEIYCANSGDSRAIVVRKIPGSTSLKAVDLTIDHKPDSPGEMKRILQMGGHVTPVRERSAERRGEGRTRRGDTREGRGEAPPTHSPRLARVGAIPRVHPTGAIPPYPTELGDAPRA